jgi:hypothetical protein
MKIWFVQVNDDMGNIHVIELFSDEAKALDYNKEIEKLYNPFLEHGWIITFGVRLLDQEDLGLSVNEEHVKKVFDPEWVAKYNTDIANWDLDTLKVKLGI